jgi:hypothetical protein
MILSFCKRKIFFKKTILFIHKKSFASPFYSIPQNNESITRRRRRYLLRLSVRTLASPSFLLLLPQGLRSFEAGLVLLFDSMRVSRWRRGASSRVFRVHALFLPAFLWLRYFRAGWTIPRVSGILFQLFSPHHLQTKDPKQILSGDRNVWQLVLLDLLLPVLWRWFLSDGHLLLLWTALLVPGTPLLHRVDENFLGDRSSTRDGSRRVLVRDAPLQGHHDRGQTQIDPSRR